tara:strand:- start:48019 stop:49257 length:1239 start_codon:yes stop_codon:yes gene_type:complete
VNDFETLDLPKRVALVHEWFSPGAVGGAEKVVKSIDQLLASQGSSVDLSSLVDGESERPESWLFKRSIQTSFIQKLPMGIKHVQKYLPLLPLAIEQLDLTDYPLVISSSHLVAKGVLLAPDQLHVSYVHTPVRYAWDQMNTYLKYSAFSRIGLGPLIRWQLHYLRQWDQLSAARINVILANSRFTARRIKRYWGRRSQVVHPPVEVDRFCFSKSRDEYYLCLCRLVPNKRVDLVVKAFNQLRLPLLVVGEGPQKSFIKSLAGPTIKVLGNQNNEQVTSLMESCRAYVYAGVEDFGIAPVEAMAAGAPVIALGKGGLLDTVRCARKGLSSATGVLFSEQNVSSLVEAVNWFEENKLWRTLDPESINNWANRFSPDAFKIRFSKVLSSAWNHHQRSCAGDSSDPADMSELVLGN